MATTGEPVLDNFHSHVTIQVTWNSRGRLRSGKLMELHISDKDLRRAISDEGKLKRRYGKDAAGKLALRIAVLRNAQSLADFWPPLSLPERCHELKGNLAGVFSIDLKHPYRLLFKPLEDLPPQGRNDELKRWKAITAIEITAIEDTHG